MSDNADFTLLLAPSMPSTNASIAFCACFFKLASRPSNALTKASVLVSPKSCSALVNLLAQSLGILDKLSNASAASSIAVANEDNLDDSTDVACLTASIALVEDETDSADIPFVFSKYEAKREPNVFKLSPKVIILSVSVGTVSVI